MMKINGNSSSRAAMSGSEKRSTARLLIGACIDGGMENISRKKSSL
jgi:hypothetical protein